MLLIPITSTDDKWYYKLTWTGGVEKEIDP